MSKSTGWVTTDAERIADLERQLAEAQQESTDAIELMQAANAAATKLGRERDEAQGKLDAVEAKHLHYEPESNGCEVCAILKGE